MATGTPACPVYTPSSEEFKDPLSYIASIRADAERFLPLDGSS